MQKNYFGNSYEEEEDDNNNIFDTSFKPTRTSSGHGNRITNYVALDRMSKIEQKSLELEFARSIFKYKVYNETKKDVEKLINNDSRNLCLISDGWSNLVQDHWNNYILTTPKPIEVDVSKISAIITDNASVMKKAWRLLEMDYPEILFL
ncbi:909_t:CDS:2, partial [Gigaspora rosea]